MSSVWKLARGGGLNRTRKKSSFVRKQERVGVLHTSKRWQAYTYFVFIFLISFFTTVLASSIFVPIRESNATEVTYSSDHFSSGGYSLSLGASANVNLDLNVMDVDTMTIGLGDVNVQTDFPTGYRLYINMATSSTSLVDSTQLVPPSIPGINGSLTTPAALTRNTWGYAIPANTTNLVDNNFSGYYSVMQNEMPDTTMRFATPPASTATPQMIASHDAPTSVSGDSYPVYYAIRANKNTTVGSYTGNVVFTAIVDTATTETLTPTPSSITVNEASTVSVATTLFSTSDAVQMNVYFLTPAEYNSISGTDVEALGISPLSCTKTMSTPVTFSCNIPAKSTVGTYYLYAKIPAYNEVYHSPISVTQPIYLTVNPNGGTWGGSTDSQSFPQSQGSTKSIDDPTGTTYTITYNANSQGATYTGTPTSVARSFTSWTLTGGGSFSNGTYTYGSEDGTLTASYNSTSNSFTLPTITKTDNLCKWAEGSASGTQYAGGTSRTITGDKTYYAVCAPSSLNGMTYMQQMTSAICNNTGVDSSKTLIDSRDQKTYTVRKLADGKCWMTQNLRLVNKTITNADSDLPSGKSVTVPASSTSGYCTSTAASCINKLMVLDSNSTTYGAYYNWYTATATYGTASVSSGNVAYSICPKGWKLPSGSVDTGDFARLYSKYGTPAKMINTSGPNLLLGGRRKDGSTFVNQGNNGYYWSSTANGTGSARFVYSSASGFDSAHSDSKYHNFPIRCVAR